MRELEGARESSREPKRANQSQEGPRGLVSQLEPVKAREPERARGSQRKPKGARESQKEPVAYTILPRLGAARSAAATLTHWHNGPES